ncbi:hypothetical protein [cyanobacterium endosymbiont of Rhopalodia gibberula]|nr:hypothetical protein [cyanobacterium endosymbiont of Rhopalodia gibberula]
MRKNKVRCTGLLFLELPYLLGEIGMAVPWSFIQKTSLASEKYAIRN